MWPLFIHSLADQDVLAIRGFTFKLLGGFSPFPLVRESPFAGLWDPEGFFCALSERVCGSHHDISAQYWFRAHIQFFQPEVKTFRTFWPR